MSGQLILSNILTKKKKQNYNYNMKTLLVDGDWCLKRHYHAREIFSSKGEHCGGVYGFLENLGMILNKTLPDRVVVVWDGDMSGKLRLEDYPLYKYDHKSWDEDSYMRTVREIDDDSKKKVSISNQKVRLKNIFENLFIRQVEVEYVEGDDLIAQYVLTKDEDETVLIYSRDQDYYQLIDENVFVYRPVDNIVLTPKNFKKLLGYTHKNALLLKCYKGDASDGIPGVPGIALKTLIKYFPQFIDEEYDIERIIDEASSIFFKDKIKSKSKKLQAIIGSRSLANRNRKIMNLKEPYVNQEAINEIELAKYSVLAKENGYVDRSVTDAVKSVMNEGYVKYMFNNDVNLFFTPYYRISNKEKEYTKKILES